MRYIVSTYSFAANLSDLVVEVLSKTKTVICSYTHYDLIRTTHIRTRY